MSNIPSYVFESFLAHCSEFEMVLERFDYLLVEGRGSIIAEVIYVASDDALKAAVDMVVVDGVVELGFLAPEPDDLFYQFNVEFS